MKTQSALAVEGREEILEFLLINHPLDCPICDRGGECPLARHAFKHGPGLSRFFEEKRHFKKPCLWVLCSCSTANAALFAPAVPALAI